jgi:signal transduction histidine kinase
VNAYSSRSRFSISKPRFSILVKLLLAFTLPTAGLFALFALLAYEVARADLEAELSTRLSALAAAAATQLRGKYLVDLLPGDEQELFHQNARRKLLQVKEATGVARIYVFDRDFALKVDTSPDTSIGDTQFQARLDQLELDRVFGHGDRVASVLFRGHDGLLYKAGYAPVFADPDKDPTVVLVAGVDAPATFFARLEELRSSLLIYGILLALAMGLVAILLATLITRPLRRLVEAAERIGRGELGTSIANSSRDEIGLLAHTMERMRADLKARDERLQLMLAGIAHEVRNPLGGMELYTGLLRDEIGGGDARREHVLRIERELNYLKQVVSEFLDYARRPAPEPADLDLAGLIEEVCELERGAAEAAGITIDYHRRAVPCRGDSGQLRRVLLNLVRNAVQAASASSPRAGRVTIELSPGGPAVGAPSSARVSVENTGATIPDHLRSRIFEPFFTTREKGTGLGLAFAKEIVSDHGGTIAVESSAERTRFSIVLPVFSGPTSVQDESWERS